MLFKMHFLILILNLKFPKNNFSTIKSVENVENFLSKKAEIRMYPVGQVGFTHKFSTFDGSQAVDNLNFAKNPLFRTLENPVKKFLFDAFL